jgi:hypothetical protein
MNDNLRRRYEMLLRVQNYGRQHADSFPVNSLGQELFMQLELITAEIGELAVAQQSNERGEREGTTNRGEARTDLHEDMEAISDTARAMALDAPGLEDKFRMPRSKINDVDLITMARTFAADALALKDEFIRHELPPTFLDQLNAHVDVFQQAIDGQQRSRRERASATAGLDDAVERGVNKVRQLDAVVRNKFRDDSARLAEWQSARHTERAPVAAQPPAPTPAPPAPPD